jgi:hypothetical protein
VIPSNPRPVDSRAGAASEWLTGAPAQKIAGEPRVVLETITSVASGTVLLMLSTPNIQDSFGRCDAEPCWSANEEPKAFRG